MDEGEEEVMKEGRKERCDVIDHVGGGFIEESNDGRVHLVGRTGEEEERRSEER